MIDVDLYGGTMHSSTIALRDLASSEQIKRSMMTSTNKDIEIYLILESYQVRNVYEVTGNLTDQKKRKFRPVQ